MDGYTIKQVKKLLNTNNIEFTTFQKALGIGYLFKFNNKGEIIIETSDVINTICRIS